MHDPGAFIAKIRIALIELKRLVDQFTGGAEIVAPASLPGLLKQRSDLAGLLLQRANVFDLQGQFSIAPVKFGRLAVELKRFLVTLREDRFLGFRQQLL